MFSQQSQRRIHFTSNTTIHNTDGLKRRKKFKTWINYINEHKNKHALQTQNNSRTNEKHHYSQYRLPKNERKIMKQIKQR
jgi:hypothetical protein